LTVETPAATRLERAPSVAPVTPAAASRSFAFPRADILLCLVLFVMAIVPRAAWVTYTDRPPQGR